MFQKDIFDAAIAVVQQRRLAAQREQEQRQEQVHREIPETAELDATLRNTCFSLLRAASANGTEEDRKKRLAAVTKYSEEADAMLRQILTAHGLPADYLDVHYQCSACNDTGFCGGLPCDCLKYEIGKIGAERLNRSSQLSLCSFDHFSLAYYKSLPPEQYQTMERIYQECRSYAEQFSPDSAGSILMIGSTGLGKTHLSLSIADVLLKKGFSVVYDSVGSLLHQLEKEHFGRVEQDDTLQLLLDCDLLILDDFGTEFDTNFTRATIYTILNGRLSADKPMIINTNLARQALTEQYGARILSRLFSCRIMQFYGKDIRFQKSIHANN